MSWMTIAIVVVGAVVVCAALAGILLRKPKPKSDLPYNGPILPKTYNDRYPKRSQMLVNKPPVEEETQTRSEVSPAP